MEKTKAICHRCGIEHLYGKFDRHLFKPVAYDADTKEPCSFNPICYRCDDIENVAMYIKEKADHRGYENALLMSEDKFGEYLTERAIEYLTNND